MGSHTYSTGGVTWCLSLMPCRSEASQGHPWATRFQHMTGIGWCWIKPCLFGAREKPRLEARAPLPTFCLQKVLWEPRWDSQDMVANIHGIKTNNFNSIIRKKHLKTLGTSIISRNGDDPIYDLFHLQAIGALSFCHSSPDSAWTISSHIHYILLNDCHAPWSSLCHLSPRCPWTTAWVKSHATMIGPHFVNETSLKQPKQNASPGLFL